MPSRLVPRTGAKRPFKRLARALLREREGFRAINQQCLALNAELLVDISRLQARPEFAFSFAAGPVPVAAAAEEEISSEQLDTDFGAWIDQEALAVEADIAENSQQLDYLFAGVDMSLPASSSAAAAPPSPSSIPHAVGSMEQTMTDDSAEVSRYREEIADLISRNETLQTQLASYEERDQEYQQTARANESLRQDVQSERSTRQQVDRTFEHFQLQYRSERASLADTIAPGLQIPDDQSVHEHVRRAIEQLRRDNSALAAARDNLDTELSVTRAQWEDETARNENLELQNEAIRAQLDANVAAYQDSLTASETQLVVSDALADLSAQFDESQLEIDALKEENANQKEELGDLRRFREQYSSPTARTHRRYPSSRPGSMVMGSTNLEDEISSAAVSGDDIDDSLSLLQPQFQVLGTSDLMEVEVLPTSPPRAAIDSSSTTTQDMAPQIPASLAVDMPTQPNLGHSSIMMQDTLPARPSQQTFDFSSNMAQDMQPTSPAQQAFGFSSIMAQDIQPHSPAQPTLDLSSIMAQGTQTQSPAAPMMEFSSIMTQATQPKSPPKQALPAPPPKPKFNLRLTRPQTYVDGIPPEFREMLRKRQQFSPIVTIHEQAPIIPAQIHPAHVPASLPQPLIAQIAAQTLAVKQQTTSVAVQADVPLARLPMSTSASAISLVLALLFVLLARLCATRFAFYNAMRTANTITDWHAGEVGYNVVSYASPYQPTLGVVIHDILWGAMHLLLDTFGAGDKASVMHYRVATWWG